MHAQACPPASGGLACVAAFGTRGVGGEAGAVVGVGGAEMRGFAAAGGLDGAGEGEGGGDGGEDEDGGDEEVGDEGGGR